MKSTTCILGALSVTLAASPFSAAWVSTSRHSSTFSSSSALSAAITLDGQEIRAPIAPLSNNIFVRVKDTLIATDGGILLPDQSQERPTEGLVVESGPGQLHPKTGVLIPNPIEKGMSVVYKKFTGKSMEYMGEDLQIIRDDDVLLYYTGVTMKVDLVTPLRDYVLIELDDRFGGESTQTSSGIAIAAQVVKNDVPCEGKVVKVGEGRTASLGTLSGVPVQPGEAVKFKDYGGNDVMIEGKPFSVVKSADILCTFEEN